MSLINDALKRATRNQQTPAAVPAPEPAAPMQPVEYRRSGGLPWYFIPAVLAIIAAACWFIVKGVQARRAAKDPAADPAASQILVKAREPQPEPSAPEPSATPTQAPAAIPTGASPTTPATPNSTTTTAPGPATEAPASPSPAPAPPPEPPKPAYKLQGIFFRPSNPSALVNGKPVSIGSRIDGATVKAITRDNLTLEVNGQTTVLTME